MPCSTHLIVTVPTDDLQDSATLLKSNTTLSKNIKAAPTCCTTAVNTASWAQLKHTCSERKWPQQRLIHVRHITSGDCGSEQHEAYHEAGHGARKERSSIDSIVFCQHASIKQRPALPLYGRTYQRVLCWHIPVNFQATSTAAAACSKSQRPLKQERGHMSKLARVITSLCCATTSVQHPCKGSFHALQPLLLVPVAVSQETFLVPECVSCSNDTWPVR